MIFPSDVLLHPTHRDARAKVMKICSEKFSTLNPVKSRQKGSFKVELLSELMKMIKNHTQEEH